MRVLDAKKQKTLPTSQRPQYPLIKELLLMDKILHDLKDSKLWELWYIPYNG